MSGCWRVEYHVVSDVFQSTSSPKTGVGQSLLKSRAYSLLPADLFSYRALSPNYASNEYMGIL